MKSPVKFCNLGSAPEGVGLFRFTHNKAFGKTEHNFPFDIFYKKKDRLICYYADTWTPVYKEEYRISEFSSSGAFDNEPVMVLEDIPDDFKKYLAEKKLL